MKHFDEDAKRIVSWWLYYVYWRYNWSTAPLVEAVAPTFALGGFQI